MKLSIVSDELSDDFETAVEIGVSWHLRAFELRNAWMSRVPNITSAEIPVIKRVIEEYGITLTTLSPGLFKIPLRSEAMENHKDGLLRKSFDLARELGTSKITVFGIRRSSRDSEEDYRKVLQIIGEAVTLAESEGFTLILENEAGWWADTGTNTAKIVGDIGSRALKINWDPGNAFAAGETPYPDGYEAVREVVANVHIKQAVRDVKNNLHYLKPSGGYLDLKGQLEALTEDGFDGYVAVETHNKPRIEKSRECLELIREAGVDCL